MKIKSIEFLKLVRRFPEPRTPPRGPLLSAMGKPGRARNNPQPIHRYQANLNGLHSPGEAFFTQTAYVRVTAEDGSWGIGSTHWGEYIKPIVERHIAPLLAGRDCMATELLNDLMWRSFQRMGHAGLTAMAQAAVDIALWDLKGKLLGVPVYSLLGGPARDELDVYVTTGNVDWAMELGFRRFKIHNFIQPGDGLEGINRLEEYVAETREKIGPDAELMLNAVMSYDVEFAIRVAERLLPYRLSWFEEPLMPWDDDGHVRIKAAVPGLPLATGETHRGRHAFRSLIERRGVDIVQPDISWTGGMTETAKIYGLAEAAGLAMVLHVGAGRPEGQHFSLAMPGIPQAEFNLRTPAGIPLEELSRVPGMALPVNGKIRVSDAPGLGLEYRADDFAPFD
ncbi:mandelate racemase/muconate lactonizing enzyme family protein [Sphingosinicella terrae]|uniref:mandelate racemase/muconate lactonizing enzyme family protein n=1 Tax=Sphingosinicella terrae TaxID=2172047 RepID=UPI000E0D8D23|nr:mandelate racemase/muconate lactonizing enzyme family protein [Sphingosinicella terrae]